MLGYDLEVPVGREHYVRWNGFWNFVGYHGVMMVYWNITCFVRGNRRLV
jgi:hypothetical protein